MDGIRHFLLMMMAGCICTMAAAIRYPMYGIELNRKTFQPIGTRKEMYLLQDWRYGWQRFGEHMDNTFLDPFIEGSWMTKHNGKYYLQYGAPGTEFSGYADGVVVGSKPSFGIHLILNQIL